MKFGCCLRWTFHWGSGGNWGTYGFTSSCLFRSTLCLKLLHWQELRMKNASPKFFPKQKILHYTRLSRSLFGSYNQLHSTTRNKSIRLLGCVTDVHKVPKRTPWILRAQNCVMLTVHVSTFRIRPARINQEPSPLESGQTVFTTRHYQP